MTVNRTKTYTIRQLAELSGFTQKSIWYWIDRGILNSTRYGGPLRFRHRITEEDWQAFIAGCNTE